ncbi:hypothetical protein [Streptomyces sp. XY332]|uniref:hypothetical protein n=1 Tax=Streptomyces sp. XY332 TaxID=1415561 RepID=UPI001F26FD1A|nr:hypothetical protein [Streptomyces sp. XY332]
MGVEHLCVPDERVEMAGCRVAVVRGFGRFHVDECLERGECFAGAAGVMESGDPRQERPGESPAAGPVGQDRCDQLGHGIGGLGIPAFLGESGSPLMQPHDHGISGQFGLCTADGEHLGAHGESVGASAHRVQLSLARVEGVVQNVRAGRFGRIDGPRRGHRFLAQRQSGCMPFPGAGVVAQTLQGLGQER